MIATTRQHNYAGANDESSNDPVAVLPPPNKLGEKLYRSLTSYANIEESMKLASLPSIDVNYMDSQGTTPLMLACSQRHYDLVKVLVEKGAKVNHVDKSKATVLSKAVGSGNLEIVQLLISSGAEVAKDKFALAPAVQYGYAAIFDLLMEGRASLEQPNQHVLPLLEAAILRGDLPMVQRLKEGGADIHKLSAYYFAWRTPLMAAAGCGEERIFQYLCAEGADPTARNQKGESVLMFAALGNSMGILNHCLQQQANNRAASAASLSGETALMWAAGGSTDHSTLRRPTPPAGTGTQTSAGLGAGSSGSSVDVMEALLGAGADRNATTKDGRTALMFAAAAGRETNVKFLLERGANGDARTEAGETALMLAAQNGKANIVSHLLDQGADPTLRTKNDSSALLYAARGGCAAVVRRLLSAGLDVNHSNKDQETPLMRAVQYRHTEVVRVLLDHNANPNIVSKGTTPLHWAAAKGHTDIAALLVLRGADTEWKNAAGQSALYVARGAVREAMERAVLQRRREQQQEQTMRAAAATATARDKQNAVDKVPPLPPDRQAELRAQMEEAIEAGDDVVRVTALLATPGIDVDYKFEGSETALISACYKGRTAVAQLLVDAGANLDLQDSSGWTALHWAAHKDLRGIVRLLLHRGANTTIKGEATRLHKGKTAEQLSTRAEIRAIFREFGVADETAGAREATAQETARGMTQDTPKGVAGAVEEPEEPAVGGFVSSTEAPSAATAAAEEEDEEEKEPAVPQETMGGSAPLDPAVVEGALTAVTALSLEFVDLFGNNSF